MRHVTQADQSVRSQDEFARQKTLEWLEHGAIASGTLGSISGLLMGLSSLAIPGVGPVVLMETLTGAFYGIVSGGLLGAAFGSDISPEQIKLYIHQLTQGHLASKTTGS